MSPETEIIRADDVGTEEAAAPEGGKSWLIVIPVALNKMAFWGVLPCFGVVFADVLSTRPGEEGISISSTMGIFSMCVYVSGLFSPALFRVFSFRQVGVVGGLLYFVGSLTAAFSTSVLQIRITYGALQGIGFGLMLSANMSTLNMHFRRMRTVAMAVVQCVNSAGSLGLPMTAQALQASAGSRAAKLAFSALSAAAAVSLFLLKPPPAPTPPARGGDGAATPEVLTPLNNESNYHDESEHPSPKSNTEPVILKRTPLLQTVRRFSFRLWQLTGIHGDTISDWRVLVTAFGIAIVDTVGMTFLGMFPVHLRTLGLSEWQVAQVLTAASAGDFTARVLLILAGRWLGNRNRRVHACSCLGTAVADLSLSLITSWYPLLAAAAVMGFCKGMIFVTVWLTVAEIVPVAKFPSALAVVYLINICVSVVVSPLLGFVRDATGSFPACFWMIVGITVLSPVSWGLHAAWQRRRRRGCHAEEALQDGAVAVVQDGGHWHRRPYAKRTSV